MAVDISSGVNSIIAASGQGQRVAQVAGENARQDKQQMIGAVAGLGTAYAAAKKKEKSLAALNGVADLAGVPPDSPARGDMQALTMEIKQRHGSMDAQQQADLQAKAQEFVMGHAQKMQTQRTEDAMDLGAAEDQRTQARDLATGGEISKINAPGIGPTGSGYSPFQPGSGIGPVPATDSLADSRIAKGGFSASGIKGAQSLRSDRLSGQSDMARALAAGNKPSPYETEQQRLKAQKEAGAGDFKPKESQEEKDARIEREAAARARGTNAGGGDPVENRVKELQKQKAEREASDYVPRTAQEAKKALDAAETNLREFLDKQATGGIASMISKDEGDARAAELKADVEQKRKAYEGMSGGAKPSGPPAPPAPGTPEAAYLAKLPPDRQAKFLAMTPEQRAAVLADPRSQGAGPGR